MSDETFTADKAPAREHRVDSGDVGSRVRRVAEIEFVLVVLLAAFGIVYLTIFPPTLLVADSWLTLVAGREVVENGLPTKDELTVLGLGREWTDQQWGSQVLAYAAYSLGGLGLLAVMAATFAVGAFAIAAAGARALGAGQRAIVLVFFPVLMAAPWTFTIRAQVFVLPLYTGLVWLLASEARRPTRRVYLVLPLLLIWANLHGSAALAAILVMLLAAVELVRSRGRSWMRSVVLARPRRRSHSSRRRTVRSRPRATTTCCSSTRPSGASSSRSGGGASRAGTRWRSTRSRRWRPWPSTSAGAGSPPSTSRRGLHIRRCGARDSRDPVVLARVPRSLSGGDRSQARRSHPSSATHVRRCAGVRCPGVPRGRRRPRARPRRLLVREQVAACGGRDGREPVLEPDAPRLRDEPRRGLAALRIPELRGRIAYDVRFEIYDRETFERTVRFRGEQGDDWKSLADGYEILVFETEQKPASHAEDFLAEPDARALYRDERITVIRRAGVAVATSSARSATQHVRDEGRRSDQGKERL